MHRHGYQGRKLSRDRDQRRALLKGLATSLIEEESIETTLPKAKEVVPYVEKLVTKAKKGGLHQRRQIESKTTTAEAVDKLMNVVAPASKNRDGGTLRLEKTGLRKGDNAQMARVSFVDDLSKPAAKSVPETKKTEAKAEKKTEDKKEDK